MERIFCGVLVKRTQENMDWSTAHRDKTEIKLNMALNTTQPHVSNNVPNQKMNLLAFFEKKNRLKFFFITMKMGPSGYLLLFYSR